MSLPVQLSARHQKQGSGVLGVNGFVIWNGLRRLRLPTPSSCRLLSIAFLALLLTGCVNRSEAGSQIVYTFELWVPLSVIFGAVAVGVLGIMLRNAWDRFAWVMIVVGIIGVVMGPSLFFDRTEVSADGFTTRYGFFGMSGDSVKFADVQGIRVTKETSTGRRGRRNTNYYLNFDRKDGTSAKISTSANIVEPALDDILVRAAARGLQVQDYTN